jgi:hypothetical protein
LILYRKSPQVRVQRFASPEPPFWAATTIAPYSARRATPVAIDYVELHATGAERLECAVSEQVDAESSRAPVLVDAAEWTEVVYRRGDDALRTAPHAMQLVTHALPAVEAYTIVSAWPFELSRLERLFDAARGHHWGVAVPVIFPVTTDLVGLDRLAHAASAAGAKFLAALPVEIDATARKALAQTMTLDDETYDMLFHADLEPLSIATERHIAALAHEMDLADFVVPPRWDERSNWNGAIILMLAATRMIAMNHDTELATRIARSARVVAQLDKPIARIAEAASLSIVESLDEVSVDVLTDWIESGRSAFVDHIDKQWRLRRDVGSDL